MPSLINSDDGVVSGTSGLKTTGGNDGLLNIQTNGSTAISISSGQRSTFPTTIGVGNATPSTSGSGITFPATQSASTNANTLDDYEEGTWTPVLTAATGTITSQSGTGSYVKVGRVVTCQFVVQITGGTITAIQNLTGLPFAYADQNYVTSCAREWFASGNLWQVVGSVGSAYAQLIRYDNSSTAAVNFGWGGTITYITYN